MARSRRSKQKQTPRKGKSASSAKEKSMNSNSSLNSNLGRPFAGIVAVAVVLVAILVRPTPNTKPTTTATTTKATPDTILDNQTIEKQQWEPAQPSAFEPEESAPSSAEHVNDGFRIAAFHNIEDSPPDKDDLLHYLRYDDGYTVCLKKEDLQYDDYGVWELKQAKLEYLVFIANDEAHWIAESPMARHATCRILTLTHQDHEAVDKFMTVMKGKDRDEIVNFTLDRVNNASEFRSVVCVSRLIDLIVDQTPTSDFLQRKLTWSRDGVAAKELSEAEPPLPLSFGWKAKADKSSPFHYYENGPLSTWIRPTARLGEEGATTPMGHAERKASLVVRKNPCPVQDTAELIKGSS